MKPSPLTDALNKAQTKENVRQTVQLHHMRQAYQHDLKLNLDLIQRVSDSRSLLAHLEATQRDLEQQLREYQAFSQALQTTLTTVQVCQIDTSCGTDEGRRK